MTRREAREAAFLLLFEQGFKEDGAEETLALAAESREMKISGFGKGLFMGVTEHLAEIDAELDKALIKWDSDRITRVTRTALRLCTYEMMFTDIQTEIAVNEALELIKKYDGEESSAFANGVAGGIHKSLAGLE